MSDWQVNNSHPSPFFAQQAAELLAGLQRATQNTAQQYANQFERGGPLGLVAPGLTERWNARGTVGGPWDAIRLAMEGPSWADKNAMLLAMAAPKEPWTISGSSLGDLFHGGKSFVRRVDASMLQRRDHGFYGPGFYVTQSPEYAKAYGGRVSRFTLPPDAEVLDASLHPSKAPQGLVDAVKDTYRKTWGDRAKARGREAQFAEDVERIGSDALSWIHAVNNYAKEHGYDAVRFSNGEIRVVNHGKLVPANGGNR